MPSSRTRTVKSIHLDLQPLLEFSNVVNSSVDLRFILNTLLFTVMGKMLVSRGMILLKKEGIRYTIVSARGVEQVAGEETVVPGTLPIRPVLLRSPRVASRQWAKPFRAAGLVLLVPIVVRHHVVGLLLLGPRASGQPFTPSDQNLIASLVSLTGSAIEKAMFIEELKEANRNLDRKVQELNTLFELSKEFNVGLDAQRVIRLLTFSLLGQVGVHQYIICYEKDGAQAIVARKGDAPFEVHECIRPLNDLRGAARLSDLAKKKRYEVLSHKLLDAGFRVAIPMNVHHTTKGMILLGDKLRGDTYSDSELEFLYALGNLACVSIENARLFQEAIEKQKMEDELAIARDIQQGLLPRTLPEIPGFELAAINISSKQVGGDYYDVIPRPPQEYVIAIGDVSGKGTPAALLMANVQAALRALVSMGLSLSETTARINNLATENTGIGTFITLFSGTLNITSRELCYVNAGHNLPFLLRADGIVQQLDVGGMILGMMKTSTPYQEGRVTLQPGDVLFLYTDGVSEAMNARGKDFTEERLLDVLLANRQRNSQEIINAVRDALTEHTQETPQSDDITMVVLRAL